MQTLTAAKKLLKKAQGQAAAKQRRDIKEAIMDSCISGSKDDFYKLVSQQRRPSTKQTNVSFGRHADEQSQANSWANYFKELATPCNEEHYDKQYHRHLQISYLLQALTAEEHSIEPVSTADIAKHVDSLKKRKAPDIHGVAAEHIKLSSPLIIDILCQLTNAVMASGKLPESFKKGSITPVLKKGKTAKNPNHYRRITITSIVGKVLEKHMIKLMRPVLDPVQSRLQFGFTSGNSPICAALVITELMAEARDNKQQMLITFMDTSKAFDVVDHRGMLNALYQQGINGTLWKLFDSMYTGIQSMVKWKGEISNAFSEQQGIRQGGSSSSDCYKAGKNKLLTQLDAAPSHRIGSINAGAVMVADDLALVANSSHAMQVSLNMAEADASRERYKYNTDKTKTVAINTRDPPVLKLNGAPLGVSPAEVHVGVHRTNTNNNLDTVHDRIQKARRASYSLMGAGLCGLNGVGPEVALLQYKTYVLPTLLYGLEAIVLGKTEMELLEAYHRKNLRYIQHLPQSTAIPAIHLLSGILPVEAFVDSRSLGLARDISAADSNSPPIIYMHDLLARQLAMKDANSSSWASHIRKLLLKYSLPSAYSLLSNPPSKKSWKASVKQAVFALWTRKLQENAEDKSTLSQLNIPACKSGSLHPVWLHLESTLDVRKATVQAQLLVQRYPLGTSRTAGKHASIKCQLCKEDPETTTHFVLQCSILAEARRPYLPHILNMCRYKQISIDPETLTRVILDTTHLPSSSQQYKELCRNMLYKLHHKRAIILGGVAGYTCYTC